jgi:dynactin complex subunit
MYENQIMERVKVIEEFKTAKRQLEKNVEIIQNAQKSDNLKIKKLAGA